MSKKNKESEKRNNQPDIESQEQEATQENPNVEESSRQEASAGMEVDSPDRITQLELEVDELKQRLQRLGADYQNYQRRSHGQMEQAVKFANENLVKSLLPVLDNFVHTLENLEKAQSTQDPAAIHKGIQIVYDHLMDVLKGVGMQKIVVSTGCEFDPAMHEAMLHEEHETLPENFVVRELQAGYVLNDRTIRPAKVSVAKAPTENRVENPDEDMPEPREND